MKHNTKAIIPVSIFVITVILGLILIVISERLQKQPITYKSKAQVPESCNGFITCPPYTTTVKKDLGNGCYQTCKITYYAGLREDPVDNDNDGIPDVPESEYRSKFCAGLGEGNEHASCGDSGEFDCSASVCDTPSVTVTMPVATETPVPTVTQPVATVTPSSTPTPSVTAPPSATPSPTKTPTPSATPIPHACGYTSCDTTSNPCSSGLICVTAKDNKNYCSQPAYEAACKANPSVATCCTAPTNTPTPGPSSTPRPGPSSTPGITTIAQATNTPAAPTIPSAGVPAAWFFVAAPLLLVVLGLLF